MFNALKNRDTSKLDRVNEAFEAKRQQARAEYESKLESLEVEHAQQKNAAMDEARENDPLVQQQRAHAEAMHAAQQRAARRVAALIRLADAEIRRKSPTPGEVAAASNNLYGGSEGILGPLKMERLS